MRNINFLLALTLIIGACGQNNSEQLNLDLKENELALTKNENHHSKTDENEKIIKYNSLEPCSFSVDLPSNLKLKKLDNDSNMDHCDCVVKTSDGFEIIEISSLLSSRFSSSMEQMFAEATKNSDLDITYKVLKEDWFVISGKDKNNGNIIYWKRAEGDDYISDLRIGYPINRKSDIEPYISTISSSFKSY
jgi:hypothetical protein